MRRTLTRLGWKWTSLTGAALAIGLGTAIAVSSSAASTSPSVITGGQTLPVGGELESADGHYQLLMLASGNLAEYEAGGGRLIWSAGTSGSGNSAVLEPSGELVVQSSTGAQLWSDNATTPGCPALNVLDDGNVAVEGPSSEVWESGTVSDLDGGDILDAGQALYSPNEDYELVMEPSGDLILYNSSLVNMWSSGTSGSGNYAEVTPSGDFEVLSAAGTELWDTGTSSGNDYLYLQPDGNLVLYPPGGGPAVWASNTSSAEGAAGPGSGNIEPVPQYGSSSPCTTSTGVTSPGSTSTGSTGTGSTNTVSSTTTTSSPSSTVVTVTVPQKGTTKTTRKLKALQFKVYYHWYWNGVYSYLGKITFGKVPSGLHWEATVTPTGKHAKARVVKASTAAQRRTLLLFLERQQFSVGETVKVTISRAGYTNESVTFKMRLHKLPEQIGAKPTSSTKK